MRRSWRTQYVAYTQLLMPLIFTMCARVCTFLTMCSHVNKAVAVTSSSPLHQNE